MKSGFLYRWVTFAAAAVSLALAGCGTWVEVSPDARAVTVIDQAAATGCRRVGTSTASVSRNASVFARNPQTVNADLVNIARNDAAELGGNAVAPLERRHQGKQRFGIYRCDADQLAADKTRQRDGEKQDTGFKTMPYPPPA